MRYSDRYKGYGWIKVAKHKEDPEKSPQENYLDLQKHHIAETTFLIEEIRNLAKALDDEKARADDLQEKIGSLES